MLTAVIILVILSTPLLLEGALSQRQNRTVKVVDALFQGLALPPPNHINET